MKRFGITISALLLSAWLPRCTTAEPAVPGQAPTPHTAADEVPLLLVPHWADCLDELDWGNPTLCGPELWTTYAHEHAAAQLAWQTGGLCGLLFDAPRWVAEPQPLSDGCEDCESCDHGQGHGHDHCAPGCPVRLLKAISAALTAPEDGSAHLAYAPAPPTDAGAFTESDLLLPPEPQPPRNTIPRRPGR